MTADPDWQADVERYGLRTPFLKEQSIWAVWVYRFGRRVDRRPEGFVRKVLTTFYWLAYRIVETAAGITLPKSATIGPGLRIWHFGGVVVHPQSVIGARCTLRQGVTIGNRIVDGPVPRIGDDVECGAYAQILGGIRIGNACRIGAMSVVLDDMPDGSTAVGVPARIILSHQAGDERTLAEVGT